MRALTPRLNYVGGSALQRVIPLLLLPAFVRFLSPTEYGYVAVLTAAFTLVTMTFGLGQDVVEYRYWFDESVEGRASLAAGVLLHLLVPVPLAAALAAVVLLLPLDIAGTPPGALALSICAGGIFVTAWRFPAVILRCEERTSRYLALAIGYAALGSISKLWLVVWAGLGTVGWALGDLVAATVLLLVTIRAYGPSLRGRLWADLGHVRLVLRLGAPVAFSQSARWASGFADRVMVVGLVSAAAGGSYLVATQLVSVGALLVLEMSTFLQPVVARSATIEEAVGRTLSTHLTSLVGVSLAAALGSVVLVRVGFAGDYRNVEGVAVVLSASLVPLGLGYLAGDLCGVRLGATRYLALASVVTGITAVVLALLLIPWLGVWGAAVASVGTQVVGAMILWARILGELPRRGPVVLRIVGLSSVTLAGLGLLLLGVMTW